MTDTTPQTAETPATEVAAHEAAATPTAYAPHVQVIKPEHTGARVSVLVSLAATLVAGGYRLDGLQVVDQFRWSSHVELVATFRRG